MFVFVNLNCLFGHPFLALLCVVFFQGSRGDPTFSRGEGVSYIFSKGGGVQMVISIETHITCDFLGGYGPLSPPSGSAHVSYGFVTFQCVSWSTSEHKGEADTVENV